MGIPVMVALGDFMKSPKSLIFNNFQHFDDILSIYRYVDLELPVGTKKTKNSKKFLVIGVDSCQKPPGIASERPQWPPRPPQSSQSAPRGSRQKGPLFLNDHIWLFLYLILATLLGHVIKIHAQLFLGAEIG